MSIIFSVIIKSKEIKFSRVVRTNKWVSSERGGPLHRSVTEQKKNRMTENRIYLLHVCTENTNSHRTHGVSTLQLGDRNGTVTNQLALNLIYRRI